MAYSASVQPGRPLAVGVTVGLALLALTGCGSTDPDGGGAEIVDDPTSSVETSTTTKDESGDKPGSRENPVPAGTTVRIGDWEVELAGTILDAG